MHRSLAQWLDAYRSDHQHPLNIKIHKACVPLILFSLIGLLTAVPYPTLSKDIPTLFQSWAFVVHVLALAFYARLSWRCAGVMGFVLWPMLIFWDWLIAVDAGHVYTAGFIFFVAWVLQFVGHKVEGRKPAFFTDVQFLLIGPLWTFERWLSPLKKISSL
jgi:uncharacterized membrane protein YGL010W